MVMLLHNLFQHNFSVAVTTEQSNLIEVYNILPHHCSKVVWFYYFFPKTTRGQSCAKYGLFYTECKYMSIVFTFLVMLLYK